MRRQRIGGAIRANVGNAEAYRKALDRLIEEMNASLHYWLVARWRDNPPTLAMDESWIGALRRTMRELAARWQSRFDEIAPKLAKHFATRAADRATGRVAEVLRDAGWTIEFKASPAVRTAMGAAIEENVTLIKTIASRHLADVSGIVMRAAATGGDLEAVSKQLHERFNVPKKHAAFIARDQGAKVHAVITRVRQQEGGIDRAIWVHSHAGKTPRPEHVSWDAHQYDVAKGIWSQVDNAWVWPGTAINCRCFSRPVLPGF